MSDLLPPFYIIDLEKYFKSSNSASSDSNPMFYLNYGFTGTPTQNAGIYIMRGTEPDVQLIWNEASDIFKCGYVGSEVRIAGIQDTPTNYGIPYWVYNKFETDTNKLTILENGNLGIGSSTPLYKLDIVGDSRLTGNAIYCTQINSKMGLGTVAPSYKLDVIGSTRISEETYLMGYVGIGKTTPSYNLDVVGTVNISQNTYIGGNLGINTLSPTTKLDIIGNAKITDNLFIGTTTPTSSKALLELKGDKGLLLPRMSSTNIDGLSAGVNENGMIVYDTNFNNIKYFDGTNWNNLTSSNLESYLLYPPPQIQFNGVATSTPSKMYIRWNYPLQTNFGFMSSWLPLLNSLSTTFYNSNYNSNTVKTILDKVSTTDFISTSTPVTGVVLVRNTGVSGIQTLNFPPSNTPVKSYVFYDPLLSNITTTSSLTAWYSNYNLSNNTNTINVPPFTSPGNPSECLNLTLSYTSGIVPITATFNYTQPTTVDLNEPIDSSLTITSYTRNYSTTGSLIRYNGPIAQTNSPSTVNSTTFTPSNILPDCLYTFSVFATNSAGNQSVVTTITGTSTPLPPLSGLSTISFPSRYITAGSGRTIKAVNDNSTITTLVTDKSTNWTSNQFTIPIHNTNNRGSTSNSIMTLSCSLNAVVGPTITFNGFPAVVPSPVTSGNLITLTPSTVVDAYNSSSENGYKGFYLNAVNNTVTIDKSNLVSSRSLYTVSVSQIRDVTNTGTYSYYFDDISGLPTITSLSINYNTTSTSLISGVRVVYNTPTLTYTCQTGNMGRFFYRTPLLSLTNTISSVITNITETDLTNITSGIAVDGSKFTDGNLTFIRNFTPSSSLNNYFTKTINLSATSSNIVNDSSLSSTTLNSIIDGLSNTLVYTTLSTNLTATTISKSTSAIGYRIWTAPPLNGSVNVPYYTYNNDGSTLYSSIQYNNQWDISLSDGGIGGNLYNPTTELQVYNGAFRTKGTDTNGYLNYSSYKYNSSSFNTVNYSSISTTGYRYASFVWNIAENTTSQYITLSFRVYGLTPTPDLSTNYAYISGSLLRMYYRLENASTPNPSNETNISTIWLDANSSTNLVTSTTYYILPPDSSYVRGGYTSISNQSGYTQFNVLIPSPFLVNTGQTIRIYCRFGLPMDKNISFNYIQAIIG